MRTTVRGYANGESWRALGGLTAVMPVCPACLSGALGSGINTYCSGTGAAFNTFYRTTQDTKYSVFALRPKVPFSESLHYISMIHDIDCLKLMGM